MDQDRRDLTRRGVLQRAAVGGVALPLLAACGADGGSSGTEAQGTTLAGSDVPVGGGTILADHQIVVTQPSQGDFKAFSAVCTHQGCPVQAVADGKIQCPCHGSSFSVEDGSVIDGPATVALEAVPVSVEGDQLTVG